MTGLIVYYGKCGPGSRHPHGTKRCIHGCYVAKGGVGRCWCDDGIALSLAITVDANRDAKSTIRSMSCAPSEVYSRVKNDYVEPVSDKKLIEQGDRRHGVQPDPHSTFLDESGRS